MTLMDGRDSAASKNSSADLNQFASLGIDFGHSADNSPWRSSPFNPPSIPSFPTTDTSLPSSNPGSPIDRTSFPGRRPPSDSTFPNGWSPSNPFPSSEKSSFPGTDASRFPGKPWTPPDITPDPGADSHGDNVLKRQNGGNATSNAAVDAFNNDRANRTESSFDNAVEKGKKLGAENEVALELLMRDWLAKKATAQPLTFMRGTAVLSDALGQFRLEEGSRLDLTSHADKKPRSLKGYDFDFGGEATTWLRMAAGSLVNAQQYVINHKGLVIDGQPMDDAYLRQLKNEQTKVESKLDTIYGPHDMESIYSEIRRQVRSNSGDMQQALVRLKYQLDDLKSTDSRFIAKSARDVALGMYAEADYMVSQNNGEEAKIMFQSGEQYSAMSNRYDRNAPDNVFLADLSARIKPTLQNAIDNQWNDPLGNPFNIPKPDAAIA